MTMSYEFAMAAMLAIVVSNLVSNLVFGHSFFDRQLLDRGIDVSQGRGQIEMMELPVLDIVSDDYVAVPPDASVSQAINAMIGAGSSKGSGTGHSEAYIIDADGVFGGKIILSRLITSVGSDPIIKHLSSDIVSIKHDASLQQATEIASGFVGESIPVIDRDHQRLIGVVSEGDLLRVHLNLHTRIRDLERA